MSEKFKQNEKHDFYPADYYDKPEIMKERLALFEDECKAKDATLAALREEVERLKAAERIRVAGLRETRDALVEKLRAEVERLSLNRDEILDLLARAKDVIEKLADKWITYRVRAEQAEKDTESYNEVGESLMKEVKRLDKELEQAEQRLAAAEGKVEKAKNCVNEAMETYTNLQDEHPYFVDVFDKLYEILGEP